MRTTRSTSRLPRGLIAVASGAALAAGAWRLLSRRYLRVAVAGASMTPALQADDFLVLRAGPPPLEGAAGCIVALRDPRPDTAERLFLKRIIGLPGESLRVGGAVQINGRVLDEPYAHGETPHEQHRGINRLGDGEFFVLGDHRGASTDSRDFGPVRAEAIIGTAVFRYWPPGRIGPLHAAPRRFLGVEPAPPPRTHPLPWLEGGPAER